VSLSLGMINESSVSLLLSLCSGVVGGGLWLVQYGVERGQAMSRRSLHKVFSWSRGRLHHDCRNISSLLCRALASNRD
jgi:hypothetical protein